MEDIIKNPLDEVQQSTDTQVTLGNPLTDANSALIFENKIAIPYIDVDPTTKPNPTIDGYRYIYNDGTNYWLYIFSNNGWRKQQFIGLQFPTDDPGADRLLFWDDSAGKLAWLTAGTGLSISGTTISVTAQDINQIVENYTKADSSIAAGDIVSLLEGGSTDFWLIDLGDINAEIGKQTNPNRAAAYFVAPIKITGFDCKVWLKETGASSSDVDVVLASDSSGVPGSTVETQTISNTLISGSYAQFTVTFTSALTAGTGYWIYLSKQGSADASNYYTTKVPTSWSLYSSGATYNGSSWSANSTPMNVTLTKNITAGLYRTLDVPNNVGLQDSVKGIAKTVNSGDCDVVISGKYQSSGTPYTAGVRVCTSSSTAGGISATGNVVVGRAVSTSIVDVFSNKPTSLKIQSSFETVTSPSTITIMTGLKPQNMTSVSKSGLYLSVGSRDWNGLGYTVKMKSGANPSQGSGLWDTDDTGVGSTGGYANTITINKSSLTVDFRSNAATKNWIGDITFTT